jgi:hypothetical protein
MKTSIGFDTLKIEEEIKMYININLKSRKKTKINKY